MFDFGDSYTILIMVSILTGIIGYLLRKPSCPYHKAKGRIQFSSLKFNNGIQIKGIIMAFLLRVDQAVTVSIQPVDKFGNPAKVDGVPVWADATDQTTVVAAADGLSATITPKGPLGTTQISVTADADLGDGVSTIGGVLDLEVVAGQAVALTINTGTPVNV